MRRFVFSALSTLGVFTFILVSSSCARAQALPYAKSNSAVANPATHFAYIADWDNGAGTPEISQVDMTTNMATTIPLCGGASSPIAVAVDPVTNMVYTANYGTGSGTTVSVLTGAQNVNGTVTNAACSTNITSIPAAPWLITVNPVTNVIYVASYSSGSVTAIDGANNSVINTVTGIAASSINALAINPVTNYVYVAYGATSPAVNSYTGATNTGTQMALAGTITTGADYPSMISIDPVTNEVYVANCAYTCTNSTANESTLAANYFLGSATSGAAATVAGVSGESNDVNHVQVNPVTNVVYGGQRGYEYVQYFTGATGGGGNAGAASAATATNYEFGLNFDTNLDVGAYDGGSLAASILSFNPNGSAETGTGGGMGADGMGLDPVIADVMVADYGGAYASSWELIYGASSSSTTATGTTPAFVAVNPVSGNVYVANSGSGTVSAYSNANPPVAMAGSPITVGTTPVSIAVDPVTSTVYVANKGSANMTVIDESSSDANATSTVTVGTNPVAVVVNPVSNQVYVANNGSNNVTVYNENSNTTSTINSITTPFALLLDQAKNLIYVLGNGGSVYVINGATNTVISTLAVGTQTGATNQEAMALNAGTHTVYVANHGSNNVSVITGCPAACAVSQTVALSSISAPVAVAVNPATADVIVADYGSNGLSVINGLTNAVIANTTGLGNGCGPAAIAVNTLNNMVYVVCSVPGIVHYFEGSYLHAGDPTGPAFTLASGAIASIAFAGNSSSNLAEPAYAVSGTKLYELSNTYTQANSGILAAFPTSVAGSTTGTDYVPNDAIYATTSATPTFTVTAATTGYANQAQTIPVTGVYWTLDNGYSAYTPVTTATTGAGTNNTTWTINPTGLTPGVHTLWVFATYGDESGATSGQSLYDDLVDSLYVGSGNNPNIGPLIPYNFVVLAGYTSTTTTLSSSLNPAAVSAPVTYMATVTPASGTIPTSDTVSFYDGVTAICSDVAVTAGSGDVTASCTASLAPAGTHSITAVFSGDSTYLWSQSTPLAEIINAGAAPTVSLSNVAAAYGSTAGETITATSNVSGSIVTFGTAGGVGGSFNPATCTIGSATATTCSSTYMPSGTLAGGTYTNDLTAAFSAVNDYGAATATSTLTISQNIITFTSVGHNFGSEPVGTAATDYTIKVTNMSATMAYPFSLNFTAANGFTSATNCPSTIAAGANCELAFYFTPTAIGAVSTTWSLSSQSGFSYAPSNGGTLSGTGTSTGGISLTTAGHDFGTQAVGTTSMVYGTELSNTTGSIETITLGPVPNGPFTMLTNCGTMLAAGANCEIEFTFSPTTTSPVSVVVPLSGTPTAIKVSGAALPSGGITLSGN